MIGGGAYSLRARLHSRSGELVWRQSKGPKFVYTRGYTNDDSRKVAILLGVAAETCRKLQPECLDASGRSALGRLYAGNMRSESSAAWLGY
jgi:hypothetical protein